MGRLNGILRIEGTLDNMTFYRSIDGLLVRTKGGISKERIKTDPAFIRTRENGVEFGENSHAGKLLRHAANPMLMHAKDARVSSRLGGVMSKIKNMDLTSARGERKVAIGILSTAGKQVLKGFNFNDRSHLSTVLHAVYGLDTATGEVTIADFVPEMMLTYPAYATHVKLSCGFLNLNFATETFEIVVSPVLYLPINMTSTNVALIPSAVPAGTGTQFYFLLIEYFQVINAVEYPLNNGAFNALGIIEVV